MGRYNVYSMVLVLEVHLKLRLQFNLLFSVVEKLQFQGPDETKAGTLFLYFLP